MYFEDDPDMEFVEYQCQDGTEEGTERGYFLIPDEKEWPRCLYSPLCPEPPAVPFEGYLNISAPYLEAKVSETCQTDGSDLHLVCPSFLRLDIVHAVYGRLGGSTRRVCTGQKNTGPSSDCFVENGEILEQVRAECQGQMECSLPVGGYLTDLSSGCNTNMKELNVTYSCGILLLETSNIQYSSLLQLVATSGIPTCHLLIVSRQHCFKTSGLIALRLTC